MRLVTLGTRGTDVVLAALKLGHQFTREELVEGYGCIRLGRGETLPQHWPQGVSNQIQRMGSDFSRFHEENRKLDLLTRVGSGKYAIRDEARPKLIKAANEHSNVLQLSNTLLVPFDGAEDSNPAKYNHIVGSWAQDKLMDWARQRGCTIVDTSATRAYDFMFLEPGRTSTPQIMESKGTRRSELDVALTPNEVKTLINNRDRYWLGIVYNIKIVDGQASGGSLYVTPPHQILEEWRLMQSIVLRRTIPEVSLFTTLSQ